MAVILLFLAIISPAGMARRSAPPASGPRLSRQQSCDVEAPRTYADDVRAAWCGDALVAKISLKTDTRNYVARLQLSEFGENAWRTSAEATLARIRRVVDDIAEGFRMNVAITVSASDGTSLASCSRDLIAVAASCTWN